MSYKSQLCEPETELLFICTAQISVMGNFCSKTSQLDNMLTIHYSPESYF